MSRIPSTPPASSSRSPPGPWSPPPPLALMPPRSLFVKCTKKELLENWDDLLPPNYAPAVPPEKAFPMTTITSGRSSTSKLDVVDLYHLNANHDKDKHPETVKPSKAFDSVECSQTVTMKETEKKRSNSHVRSLTSFESGSILPAAAGFFWKVFL
ncbi:hypothetical protein OPV22_006806 [Ensete ventricosum]|uniref:Uncharacterized protein n=1 Tax=Ensete ventricosum TaxID=4639 RepID=A0AAV8RTW6_ENSVE|nr:hypothetical protein OPV22_006806 [Ensete ventricosum]